MFAELDSFDKISLFALAVTILLFLAHVFRTGVKILNEAMSRIDELSDDIKEARRDSRALVPHAPTFVGMAPRVVEIDPAGAPKLNSDFYYKTLAELSKLDKPLGLDLCCWAPDCKKARGHGEFYCYNHAMEAKQDAMIKRIKPLNTNRLCRHKFCLNQASPASKHLDICRDHLDFKTDDFPCDMEFTCTGRRVPGRLGCEKHLRFNVKLTFDNIGSQLFGARVLAA